MPEDEQHRHRQQNDQPSCRAGRQPGGPARHADRKDRRGRQRRQHPADRRETGYQRPRQPHEQRRDAGRPPRRERHAEHRRHPLAAAKVEPQREQMPAERGKARDRGDVFVVCEMPGKQNRDRPLAAVEEQRRRRQPLAPGPQHVGRADIARPDRPQVARPEGPRQQQPKRDRAQDITDQRADDRGRGHGRVVARPFAVVIPAHTVTG